MQEEEKKNETVGDQLHSVFNVLKSNTLLDSYQRELYSAFSKSKSQENELKAKAQEAAANQD
jgi:histidyl-tRNA synthetase